jgi:hypothetical protein
MTRDGDNKYEVKMRNGDRAEAEALPALLRAVEQLYEDGEYEHPSPLLAIVLVNGKTSTWATTAAYHHLLEVTGETEVTFA